MSDLRKPTPDANAFVEAVYSTSERTPSELEAAISDTLKSSAAQPLQRFVGFLGKVMADQRRKVYTTSRLDEGVEVPAAAIRFLSTSPANETDGLKRDVVWVDADAVIFYFSTRPRPTRDPDGGSFPPYQSTG